MSTRIAVIRTFDVSALLTIHHPEFANWYSHGVWWAIYGDFQGQGIYEDRYLIDNVLRNIGYGWYNQPLSGALLSSGFYLGMVHGGNITPKSHTLRQVNSIVALTDKNFTDGLTRGLIAPQKQTDSAFMKLLHSLAISRASEQEIAHALGVFIGNLTPVLTCALLPASAPEAVTSASS